MADPDSRSVAVRTAAGVGLPVLVLVVVLARALLITDAWPGGGTWWFLVTAVAAVTPLFVLSATSRCNGGRRR